MHEFTIAEGHVPAALPAETAAALRESAACGMERRRRERRLQPARSRLRTIGPADHRAAPLLQGAAPSRLDVQPELYGGYARPPRADRAPAGTLFEHRFDPARSAASSLDPIAEIQAIDHELDAVESLDEDRILRAFLTLVLKTVRTNYYQTAPGGDPKSALAVKLASPSSICCTLPRRYTNLCLQPAHRRGAHARRQGGARRHPLVGPQGGFRTEILGLMKAQTVKNAVIVPVGSKGGFVVKRPPPPGPNYREQFAAEGVECYKILIRSLLDLTDNIVSNGSAGSMVDGRAVLPPPQVVRHDGDDP